MDPEEEVEYCDEEEGYDAGLEEYLANVRCMRKDVGIYYEDVENEDWNWETIYAFDMSFVASVDWIRFAIKWREEGEEPNGEMELRLLGTCGELIA